MAMDKRTLVNVAASTVAVLAILFGVKQCDDKQVAETKVAEKEATIAQLRDSLVVVNGKLIECENGKKAKKGCGCRVVRKPVAKKPVAKKTFVVKPNAKIVCVAKDTVAVVKVDELPSDKSVVINGNNTGTIIVNGNTIVNGNNNAFVNGANNVVNNGSEKQKTGYVDTCHFVRIRRVRCY